MYYALFFVALVLLACPQRLPVRQLAPAAPVPREGDAGVRTIIDKVTKQSSLNPGNLKITVTPITAKLEEKSTDVGGTPTSVLRLVTDSWQSWNIEVRGEEVNANDIMVDSFPNLPEIKAVDQDSGNTKITRYVFLREYVEGKEDDREELWVIARNMLYCRKIFNQHVRGRASESGGGEVPDMPKSVSDCERMDGGNSYNFDQKLRLSLLVHNVQDPAVAAQQAAMTEAKKKLACGILASTVHATRQPLADWTQGNSSGTTGIIRNLIVDIGLDFLEFGLATRGLDCSSY